MGKLMDAHKQRVHLVKDYAKKNKLFTVVACIIVIALIGNFFLSHVKQDNKPPAETEMSQSETVTEDPLQWRFYWIDLWILLGGGGFCTVMIIKERMKAREKL